MKQAALIIGASSGLGRSVAEQLAKAGYDVIISSRSEEDLKALSVHLQVRYQINAAVKRRFQVMFVSLVAIAIAPRTTPLNKY